jgi:hypothetical protein
LSDSILAEYGGEKLVRWFGFLFMIYWTQKGILRKETGREQNRRGKIDRSKVVKRAPRILYIYLPTPIGANAPIGVGTKNDFEGVRV